MTEYDPYLDPEALFDTKAHAKMRGCSISKIRRERRERRGVPFIEENGNTIRYRRRDIINYIEAQKRVDVRND